MHLALYLFWSCSAAPHPTCVLLELGRAGTHGGGGRGGISTGSACGVVVGGGGMLAFALLAIDFAAIPGIGERQSLIISSLFSTFLDPD